MYILKIDIIKCIMEIKQGVWWAQSPESMDPVAILHKAQKSPDMHLPVQL